MRDWNHDLDWKMADRFLELSEGDLNVKTNLAIELYNNHWTRLSQNIVIYQCLID